jgi:predicted TIM-barrel fold metal-dependent hydrolase
MRVSEVRSLLNPPWPVLDVHVHPLGNFGPHRVTDAAEDARLMAETGKRSGVEKMCLFSLHSTCPRQPTMALCRESNDYALAMRDAAANVFLPFCYVNPMYPEESVAEIERCVAGAEMCGIKLWVAVNASDARLDPIMRCAASLGVPVLQHAWNNTLGSTADESTPADVADLARRHPTVNIIMAHLNGAGLRGIEDVADCPNVYVDTSGGDPESGITEAAAASLGPTRVVYGSDAAIRHFGTQLAKVLGAGLPDAVKRDIVWNNAARLLPSWAGVAPVARDAA